MSKVGKSIKISEDAYIRLLKLKGALTVRNGKNRSISDVIGELLDFYEQHKEK
ncbi:MAG: hypothetical protein QW186_09490 [Candidatus Bathyarchaeia archaeon]